VGDLKRIPIIVFGNKIDLDEQREVTFEEAEMFCKEFGLPFFECSAKDNFNVKNGILFLVEKIFLNN
jgi:GTPase SAR1 family protein